MLNKRMEIVTFSSLKHLSHMWVFKHSILPTSSDFLHSFGNAPSLHFLPPLPGGREDPLGLCCSPGPPAAWGAPALAREKLSLTW